MINFDYLNNGCDILSDVLFLGNGINRAFNGDSWEKLIDKIAVEFDLGFSKDAVKDLPFPMQVVAVSKDNVNSAMKKISEDMNFVNTEEQDAFLQKVLSVPVDNLITANYTFELEQASGIRQSLYSYRRTRKYTKNCKGKEDKFGLFKFYQPNNSKRKIWHIHGDITKPSTVIMGNYYYGKLLSEIQTYTSGFIKRYKTLKKQGLEITEQSWVDSFLTKNVHILGFGLDTSEIDIWWLICCKKRNFPDTRIFYYVPKDEKHPLSKGKEALLKAYDIEIKDDIPFDGEYKLFYSDAIDEINKRINSGGIER